MASINGSGLGATFIESDMSIFSRQISWYAIFSITASRISPDKQQIFMSLFSYKINEMRSPILRVLYFC